MYIIAIYVQVKIKKFILAFLKFFVFSGKLVAAVYTKALPWV